MAIFDLILPINYRKSGLPMTIFYRFGETISGYELEKLLKDSTV